MTKTYTVSGQSKTRPSDLPDGFTVEETEGPFEAKIGAYSDSDCHKVEIHDNSPYSSFSSAVRLVLTTNGVERKNPWLKLKKPQVAKLRDALTEWLGDSELTVHSPEPDRSASYRDADGDVWTYDLELLGWRYSGRDGGSFRSSAYSWNRSWVDEYSGSFPWTLKV